MSFYLSLEPVLSSIGPLTNVSYNFGSFFLRKIICLEKREREEENSVTVAELTYLNKQSKTAMFLFKHECFN